jgi:putative hydrolase of the HAD superfamily
MFDIIAFDADDTLWHNESLFTVTQDKFAELLAPYHERDWIQKKLYETEIRNLQLFGYGIKGFALSLIETAVELSEGRIKGHEIQSILDAAKEMLRAPVETLKGVKSTLARLSKHHVLMVLTKGDLLDQESKLARSGLGDFFRHVEVVSQKNRATYRAIMRRFGLQSNRFLMVGNSLKSDILPVVDVGGRAVHIPYQTLWAHEKVGSDEAARQDYYRLERISQLPGLLKQIREEDP